MESADGKKHPFKPEGGRGPLHSPLAMAFAVSALLFALFFIFLPDVGTKEFSDFSIRCYQNNVLRTVTNADIPSR